MTNSKNSKADSSPDSSNAQQPKKKAPPHSLANRALFIGLWVLGIVLMVLKLTSTP
jgi:hypothetical protein